MAMTKRNHHTRETPSERWTRLLQRMLRAEVRASTAALVIIVAWLIFLVQVWQDGGKIFGN